MIEVHHLIATGEIAAAYNLHKRLTGIGPAFHTKWMWLMGRVTHSLPTPLILDARVWAGLREVGWHSRDAAGGDRRRGQRYVSYLEACQAWSATASGRTPEDVEYTLYRRGG